MLITVDDLRAIYSDLDFSKFSDERLKRKLSAIEAMIRERTHNNFIKRTIFVNCYVMDGALYGDFSKFQLGDTIYVSNGENKGLYVIEYHDRDYVEVDKPLYDSDVMRAYKVEYPLDVIEGCVELLNYDCNKPNNKGVASETISRHSVSYVQYNEGNSKEGYPSEMLGFLRKYVEWQT